MDPSNEERLPEGERPCPECGEAIKAAAGKCRHCGHFLDPALAAGVRKRWDQLQRVPGRRVWLFALLALVGGLFCQVAHSCMCGHLAHGSPYRIASVLVDGAWVGLFVIAAVRLFRLNAQLSLGARLGTALLLLFDSFFVLLLLGSVVRL
jgi:hypothetical protein